jgi:hypothetical protein
MFSSGKSAWASKTIWGSVMVVAVAGAKMLGYDLGDADQWADELVILIGATIAIYGRVTAVKKIGQ